MRDDKMRNIFNDGQIVETVIMPIKIFKDSALSEKKEWAKHYEHLIWTAEVIKNYMNAQGCTYRLADVEMALFMMGK